ncbi:MAG: transglutaminase family protein [Pseudomonadota bacterium]
MVDFVSPRAIELGVQLSATLARPDCEFDLAVIISRLVQPDLAESALLARYAEFVEPLLSHQPEHLQGLLEWFAQAHFQPPRQGVTIQHSNLHHVLQAREGIPISLAMLMLQAGRACGFTCHGINFPGHFLVRIDGLLVDPLGMQPVDPQTLAAEGARESTASAATPQMIVLRMLNNLKALQVHGQDLNQALGIVDLQLEITGPQPELAASLHFERGEYWQQLGAFGVAAAAFSECAATSPYPELKKQAVERAENLRGRAETWH